METKFVAFASTVENLKLEGGHVSFFQKVSTNNRENGLINVAQ